MAGEEVCGAGADNAAADDDGARNNSRLARAQVFRNPPWLAISQRIQ
jgi:hypothetical protein